MLANSRAAGSEFDISTIKVGIAVFPKALSCLSAFDHSSGSGSVRMASSFWKTALTSACGSTGSLGVLLFP